MSCFQRDAAHRIHPLAGMGLNLGFGDVKCLTENLAKATYSGFPLGNSILTADFPTNSPYIHIFFFFPIEDDLTYLTEYEKDRLRHNVPIMLGVHGLQRIYNTDVSPVVLLRSLGLHITQAATPLKVCNMID